MNFFFLYCIFLIKKKSIGYQIFFKFENFKQFNSFFSVDWRFKIWIGLNQGQIFMIFVDFVLDWISLIDIFMYIVNVKYKREFKGQDENNIL